MEESQTIFDTLQWNSRCSRAETEALARCGSVHDLFEQYFSEDIDRQVAMLPAQHRARAIEIATDWGYASPQEREQTQQELAKEGRCSHGLHPENCPMGCGDLPRSFFADTEAP